MLYWSMLGKEHSVGKARFDGAATFSGDKAGVQRRLKELSPNHWSTVTVMSFNWLLCKLLKLHQVSSMSTLSSDDVTEVLSLFPKTCRVIKEDLERLDLPELKIVKPTDSRWVAHERFVNAVNATYSSIFLAFDNIYEYHMNLKLLD